MQITTIATGRHVPSTMMKSTGIGFLKRSHLRASLNLFIGKPLVVELLIGSVLAKGEQRIVHLL